MATIASEAESNGRSLASSSDDSKNNSTTFLLEKARKLLRKSKRKSSPSSSCSVNSPCCGKVARNRTGLSSSSVRETDDQLLEMSLGGNKELWEMHWLRHEEKIMKEFGNDKTGNNLTILSSSHSSCSVNLPFPAESNNDRYGDLDTGTLQLQMEFDNLLREQCENQRWVELQIERLMENQQNFGHEEKVMKFFGDDEIGNNQTNLTPPPYYPSIYPSPAGHGDFRNRGLDVSAGFQLQIGKWQSKQLEIQRPLQLQIYEQEQYLPKINEDQRKLCMAWGKICKLSVPNKIKVFMWRVCEDFIPICSHLGMNGLRIADSCPVCNCQTETSTHLMFDCPVALQVWALSFLSSTVFECRQVSAGSWVQEMLVRVENEKMEKICVILWLLWENRNEKLFNNSKSEPLSIASFALRYLQQFKEGGGSG